jgi:hypothetical protein
MWWRIILNGLFRAEQYETREHCYWRVQVPAHNATHGSAHGYEGGASWIMKAISLKVGIRGSNSHTELFVVKQLFNNKFIWSKAGDGTRIPFWERVSYFHHLLKGDGWQAVENSKVGIMNHGVHVSKCCPISSMEAPFWAVYTIFVWDIAGNTWTLSAACPWGSDQPQAWPASWCSFSFTCVLSC